MSATSQKFIFNFARKAFLNIDFFFHCDCFICAFSVLAFNLKIGHPIGSKCLRFEGVSSIQLAPFILLLFLFVVLSSFSMFNSVYVRVDLFDQFPPELSVHFMYDAKLHSKSVAKIIVQYKQNS